MTDRTSRGSRRATSATGRWFVTAKGPNSVVAQHEHCGIKVILVRRGEADAALAYDPFDPVGLDTDTVAVERRVAAIATTHPLAARDNLTIADLGLPVTEPGQEPHYHRFLTPGPHQNSDLPQRLKLIELGDLLALLPASVIGKYPRPGIVYRDVTDAPPAVLAIAWPQTSRSTATAARRGRLSAHLSVWEQLSHTTYSFSPGTLYTSPCSTRLRPVSSIVSGMERSGRPRSFSAVPWSKC